ASSPRSNVTATAWVVLSLKPGPQLRVFNSTRGGDVQHRLAHLIARTRIWRSRRFRRAFPVMAIVTLAATIGASSPAVASGTPGAPTGVTATAGNVTALVTWTAPADTGSSAITSYTVTPYIGAIAQPTVTVPCNPSQPCPTYKLLDSLAPATTYTFTVAASNASGAGPAATTTAVTTFPALVPPFTTSGQQILDANGHATVFKGIVF